MKYGTGKRSIESSLPVLFIPLLATVGEIPVQGSGLKVNGLIFLERERCGSVW